MFPVCCKYKKSGYSDEIERLIEAEGFGKTVDECYFAEESFLTEISENKLNPIRKMIKNFPKVYPYQWDLDPGTKYSIDTNGDGNL